MRKTILAVLCMALLATAVVAHGDHGDHDHSHDDGQRRQRTDGADRTASARSDPSATTDDVAIDGFT